MKVDVEGFEALTFIGGRRLLSGSQSPDILFEFVDWAEHQATNLRAGDAQALLMEYGYHIYVLENNKPGKRLMEPLTKGTAMFFASKRLR